jgi:hypothetical protein
MHLIKRILAVTPYQLRLEFSDGAIRIVDLEEKIKNRAVSKDSKYRDLLDPEYFASVKLNSEWGTIYWENGIDFCPDSLFMVSEPVSRYE